jgi:predicted RNase H-like nuclease
MVSQIFIGFDSAWADKNPGAICALTVTDEGETRLIEPVLCDFDNALRVTNEAVAASQYVLLTIDQPASVPNWHGLRPVEKIAMDVLREMDSAVPPANRSKSSIYGDDAPVWRFLDATGFRQNPTAARQASHGRFLIEAVPALSMLSIAKETWLRGRAAKYNPTGKNFCVDDWVLVVEAVTRLCKGIGLANVALHTYQYLDRREPTKEDQNCLNAVICMLVGYIWRSGHSHASLVLGDPVMGHFVTPVINALRDRLLESADKYGVPADLHWPCDTNHRTVFPRAVARLRSGKRATVVKRAGGSKPRSKPPATGTGTGTGIAGNRLRA